MEDSVRPISGTAYDDAKSSQAPSLSTVRRSARWLRRLITNPDRMAHSSVIYTIIGSNATCFARRYHLNPWWRHQIETFSTLLAFCAENSPVTGESPSQRPVTRSFDVFFHLCLNKRLSKNPRGWRFKTPSRSLWRHFDAILAYY